MSVCCSCNVGMGCHFPVYMQDLTAKTTELELQVSQMVAAVKVTVNRFMNN